MPKEIVMDVTTGIIVLGSVFGATHVRKLVALVRKRMQEQKFSKVLAAGRFSTNQR